MMCFSLNRCQHPRHYEAGALLCSDELLPAVLDRETYGRSARAITHFLLHITASFGILTYFIHCSGECVCRQFCHPSGHVCLCVRISVLSVCFIICLSVCRARNLIPVVTVSKLGQFHSFRDVPVHSVVYVSTCL